MTSLIIAEGARVSYVGEGEDDLEVGDQGRVVASDRGASHVVWSTGEREGRIDFISNLDITALSSPIPYEDLDTGPLVTFAIRATYDRYGPQGLLGALADEGHLNLFMPVIEDAVMMVASRIRQDVSFQEVLSKLDAEDGSEFVIYAASALLRDAFGEDDL